MANSRAFDEAAALARSLTGSNPHFSVGCHVVLLDGEPVLPAERVSSLLQPGAQNGSHFRDKLNDFVVASFRGKLQPDEIEAEATAQIQRLQAAGVEPSHFDTHKHAHMFPAVLRPLLRAARSVQCSCGSQSIRPSVAAAAGRCTAAPPVVEAFCPAQRAAQLRRKVPPTKLKRTACARPMARSRCWSPAFST